MKVEYSELIEKVQEKKLKQLVIDGLNTDNHSFKKIKKSIPNNIIIKGFSNPSKISFRNNKIFVKPILDYKLFEFNEIAKMLFKGFYDKRKEQVKIISTELKKIGYSPIEPKFNKNIHVLNSLKDKDIYCTDGASYFRPNGKIINGIDEEDASIITALLGWAVLNEEHLKEISFEDDENIENDEIKDIEKSNKEDLGVNNRKIEMNIEKGKKLPDNNIDFEKSIVALQSDFLKSSEVFFQISEDLKKEIIPNDFLDHKAIQSLRDQIDHLKEKFGLPNDKKFNSVTELNKVYKDLQKNKDQELFDSILDILKKYKKIYHIKGQKLPFTQELNKLASEYEKSIKENTVKKDDEWF